MAQKCVHPRALPARQRPPQAGDLLNRVESGRWKPTSGRPRDRGLETRTYRVTCQSRPVLSHTLLATIHPPASPRTMLTHEPHALIDLARALTHSPPSPYRLVATRLIANFGLVLAPQNRHPHATETCDHMPPCCLTSRSRMRASITFCSSIRSFSRASSLRAPSNCRCTHTWRACDWQVHASCARTRGAHVIGECMQAVQAFHTRIHAWLACMLEFCSPGKLVMDRKAGVQRTAGAQDTPASWTSTSITCRQQDMFHTLRSTLRWFSCDLGACRVGLH